MRLTDLVSRQESTPNRTIGRRRAFQGLVLHIAEGSYEGTIAWQKNPAADVSSEFVIGRQPGEIAQMMDLEDYGWTQRSGNGYWVASENAGHVKDGLSDWQVEANAQILAWLHTHHGVPLQVTNTPTQWGLGHHSMGAESGYDWGHPDCPGVKVKSRKAEIVARARAIVEGDDMPLAKEDIAAIAKETAKQVWATPYGNTSTERRWPGAGTKPMSSFLALAAMYSFDGVQLAKTLTGRDFTDEDAIVRDILAGLDPAVIAAAIPAEIAEQVAQKLADRMQA